MAPEASDGPLSAATKSRNAAPLDSTKPARNRPHATFPVRFKAFHPIIKLKYKAVLYKIYPLITELKLYCRGAEIIIIILLICVRALRARFRSVSRARWLSEV